MVAACAGSRLPQPPPQNIQAAAPESKSPHHISTRYRLQSSHSFHHLESSSCPPSRIPHGAAVCVGSALQPHLEVQPRAAGLRPCLRIQQQRVHLRVARCAVHDTQRGLHEARQLQRGRRDVERGGRERRAGEVQVREAREARQRGGEGAGGRVAEGGAVEAEGLEAGERGEGGYEGGGGGEGDGGEGELEEAAEVGEGWREGAAERGKGGDVATGCGVEGRGLWCNCRVCEWRGATKAGAR